MADYDLEKYRLHDVDGLEKMKERGRGSFGAVYELKVSGVPCIGKRLHNILLGRVSEIHVSPDDRRKILDRFKQECDTLGQLRHPNIVQFMGVHIGDNPDDITLVMEYLHMDLELCIKKYSSTLPLQYKLRILRDVSFGLSYLHSRSVVHRDLNQGNILLTESLTAKIADLGASKFLDYPATHLTGMTTVPGAIGYMPPEAMLSPAKYDTKLDCFSFGHLSLYLLLGRFPNLVDSHITAADVAEKSIQQAKRRGSLIHVGTTHVMYEIITQCLSDEPSTRPTSRELADRMTEICSLNPPSCVNILDYMEVIDKLKMDLKTDRMDENMEIDTVTEQVDTPTLNHAENPSSPVQLATNRHVLSQPYMSLQLSTMSAESTGSGDIYTSLFDTPPQSTQEAAYLTVLEDQPSSNSGNTDKGSNNVQELTQSPKSSTSPDEYVYSMNKNTEGSPAPLSPDQQMFPKQSRSLGRSRNIKKFHPVAPSSTSSLSLPPVPPKLPQRSASPQPPIPPRSPRPPRPMSTSPLPSSSNQPLAYDYVDGSERARFAIRDGKPAKPDNKFTSVKSDSSLPLHSLKQSEQPDLFNHFDDSDEESYEKLPRPMKNDPSNAPILPPRNALRPSAQQLAGGQYIYGGISREVGEALCCNPGDFLIRSSMTTGGLVLTVKMEGGEYGHLSIHKVPVSKGKYGYFFNDGEMFDSLTDLITDLTQTPFEADSKQMITLKNPVTTLDRKILQPKDFFCKKPVVQKRQYTLSSTMIHATGEEVIAKVLSSHQHQVLWEGYILAQLDHSNVVRMIGVCVEKPICLLIEKCAKNILSEYLLTRKGVNDMSNILGMIMDLAKGLSYLHSNNIIHRNIAARNCIVTSDFTMAKVSNLQRCVKISKNTPTITDYTNFAIGWASPEVLNSGEYSEASDVWSFGVLMWEMCSQGKEPFTGLSKAQILERIHSKAVLQLPPSIPNNYQEMFTKCFMQRPQDRPRLSQLQYLFFQSDTGVPEGGGDTPDYI